MKALDLDALDEVTGGLFLVHATTTPAGSGIMGQPTFAPSPYQPIIPFSPYGGYPGVILPPSFPYGYPLPAPQMQNDNGCSPCQPQRHCNPCHGNNNSCGPSNSPPLVTAGFGFTF